MIAEYLRVIKAWCDVLIFVFCTFLRILVLPTYGTTVFFFCYIMTYVVNNFIGTFFFYRPFMDFYGSIVKRRVRLNIHLRYVF